MRVILFQDRFAPMVADGRKRQTIRKKARCKEGNWLSLRRWLGKPYRSKQAELIRARCTAVRPVWITENAVYVNEPGWRVNPYTFAMSDGFLSWPDMRDWFQKTHVLPFEGELIEWEL